MIKVDFTVCFGVWKKVDFTVCFGVSPRKSCFFVEKNGAKLKKCKKKRDHFRVTHFAPEPLWWIFRGLFFDPMRTLKCWKHYSGKIDYPSKAPE